MHKKGGGLLQPRAEREMLNAHGGGELEDEKGGLNSITSEQVTRLSGVTSQYSDIS